MIVQKHPSQRFDWFLKINYPNEDDRIDFEELRDDGKIPPSARRRWAGRDSRDRRSVTECGWTLNWTTGCISIDNSDIDELARLLPIGTVSDNKNLSGEASGSSMAELKQKLKAGWRVTNESRSLQ